MPEQDEKIPLRHGCVGQETCGCGGLAYGMRTIFPMIERSTTWKSMPRRTTGFSTTPTLLPSCPRAAACCVPTLASSTSATCRSRSSTWRCAALDIDKKDVEYDYFGLNHFGWFTSIRHKGEEVLPQLREYIKEHEVSAA